MFMKFMTSTTGGKYWCIGQVLIFLRIMICFLLAACADSKDRGLQQQARNVGCVTKKSSYSWTKNSKIQVNAATIYNRCNVVHPCISSKQNLGQPQSCGRAFLSNHLNILYEFLS